MNPNLEQAREEAARALNTLWCPTCEPYEHTDDAHRAYCAKSANAAIDAFLAAARKDGWKLVRREASDEMCKAGMAANFGEVQVRGIPQAEVKLGPPGARRVFAAMWDSAPEVTTAPAEASQPSGK